MSSSQKHPGKSFTISELKRYDGEDGRMLIAYQGRVYDVTGCPHWQTGIHEYLHFPGQDLSGEFLEAPHGEEVFDFPCVQLVGYLEDQSIMP